MNLYYDLPCPQSKYIKSSLKKYRHNPKILTELAEVVEILINEIPIPDKYRNHHLAGKYKGMLELHLRPDVLLIYVKIEKESITLIDIGSHAYLFS